MTNIYTRIGEALASQGKITLIHALNSTEENVLIHAGFGKVGTVELNGLLLAVYSTAKDTKTTPFEIDGYFTPEKYTSTDKLKYVQTYQGDVTFNVSTAQVGLAGWHFPTNPNEMYDSYSEMKKNQK